MENCKFCGRKKENNPSDYYHSKQCEADHISGLIRNKQYGSEAELNKLKSRLESARYVGD